MIGSDIYDSIYRWKIEVELAFRKFLRIFIVLVVTSYKICSFGHKFVWPHLSSLCVACSFLGCLKVVLNTFMESQAGMHKFVLGTHYLATAQPLPHQEIDKKNYGNYFYWRVSSSLKRDVSTVNCTCHLWVWQCMIYHLFVLIVRIKQRNWENLNY